MKLTSKSVRAAKPKAKRYEIADKGCPGLHLVLHPSGAKAWAFRYRFKGESRKLTLGSVNEGANGNAGHTPKIGDCLTLAQAHTLASEQVKAIRENRDPAREHLAGKRAAREGDDLFPSVLERFLAAPTKKGRTRRESTVNEWRRIIDKDVTPRWKKKRIGEITRKDVIAALDVMEARGAGITTNRVHTALKALFNYAVRKDLISVSPMSNLDKPVAEDDRERVLTDAELKTLWNTLGDVPWPHGPITKLLLLTGARRSEVAGMTWPEIDVEARTWLLPAERSKNRQERLVPLSDAALAVIETLPQIKSNKKLVFTTTGETPVSGFAQAKRAIDRAIDKATKGKGKIEGWTLHDLRRTCSTSLHRLGFPPHVCEAVLGHRTATGVALRYNRHDYAPEKRVALDTWARFILDNAAGKSANVVPLTGKRA